MAEQKRKITYAIDFEVKDTGLKSVQKELQKIKSLSLTDFSKITGKAPTKELTAELNKVNKAARVTEQALRAAYNPKLNSYNIQIFNKYLQQSGFNTQTLRAELVKAGAAGENAFRSTINSITKFNTQAKETHTILNKIGTTLANTIKWNISSSLLNGVIQSIQQAWGFAKNLDSSLNDIRVVTGKSADEMARFAERANAVASNLGKGTTDYTKAALIYAQQGLGDKDIESRTAVTLKTANVTGQSADAVSEELTAVWNGYKVSADEAELYIDRLAAVASTTASDLQELSTGMSKVASAAAAMGVGEDQLAAQLSTIISVTRQAPESVGTALRTIYARITDIKAGVDEDGVTLGQYSGKMAQMGINVLDAAGNLRDMGSVMEEIGAKWGNMTREQQVYLAQTMAGQRQYNNLLALFDNFDKYNSALKTAQNAEGTLTEQNEIHMESLSAHLQQLTTQTEKMWMHLTDTDGTKDLIDELTSIIDKVDKLFTSLGGGQAVLKSLGTIAMSLLTGPIAKGLNTTISNIKLVQSQKLENVSKATSAQQYAQYLNQQGRTEQAKIYNQKANFFKKSQGTFNREQMENISAHWDVAESAANQQDTAKAKMEKINSKAKQVVSDQAGKSQEQIRVEAKQYYDNITNQIESVDTTLVSIGVQQLEEDIENDKKALQEAEKEIKELEGKKEELNQKLNNPLGTSASYNGKKNSLEQAEDQKKLKEINEEIDQKNKQIQEKIHAIKSNESDLKERKNQFTWEPGEAFDIFKAENIGDNADDELKSLGNKYENLLNRVAKARQQGVQKGSQEYRQLNDDIKKFSEDAANYAQKSAVEMADGYKAAVQDERIAGQASTQARKQSERQASDVLRQERIQGIMQVINGFSMLQISFENLGNSLKNALDTGDWESFVGAILTSAPMLFSSLTQISGGWEKISSLMDIQIGKSAKVVAAKTAEEASSVANTTANMAQEAAKRASGQAAQYQAEKNREAAAADATQTINSTANAAENLEESATKGAKGVSKLGGVFKGLGSVLKSLGPLLIVLAVLEGFKIWGDVAQDLANKAVEANKKIIDSENEKQEQLRKQEDVIKEVEDLNKQYEQGIITRTELKEKTEQLQQKYKDESTEIQQLVKDYKNLGQVAKQAKRKQFEQLEKSTKEESKAAANKLDRKMETMHVQEGLDSWTGHMSAKISGDASIGGGWNWNNKGNAAQKLGGMLAAEGLGGYVAGQNIISLSNAHNDQEAFQQLQILQKFVDNATEEQKKSDAYKGAQEILDAMKQDIENYKNAAEQHFDALGKKIATQADIDFNKFDNLNDFSVEYKALAEDMRANFKAEHPEKTEEEIEEAVSKAMKEAIAPEAYEKFGEKQQALNKLDKNTNLGEISNDIKSMIDALDSDQLNAFLHMDLEGINSFKVIKKTLEQISQIDFSNLESLTSPAYLEASAEKYTKIQQIITAIQEGKKIGKKALQETLTEQQITNYFEKDVRGQYSIKAGKTLAEVVSAIGEASVQDYQKTYKGYETAIQSNQRYIDNKKNANTIKESYQKLEDIKYKNYYSQKEEEEEAKNHKSYYTVEESVREEFFNPYRVSYSDPYSLTPAARDQQRNKLIKFLNEQIAAPEEQRKISEKDAISLLEYAKNEQWEKIDQLMDEGKISGVDLKKVQAVNKQTKEKNQQKIGNNQQITEKNISNMKSMLNYLEGFKNDKEVSQNLALLNQYKEDAEHNKITEEAYQKVQQIVQTIEDKYKDADENIKKFKEQAQKTLEIIHDGLFPIDKDVNETIVAQLGEQFQLTAQKSKLLDDALKDNARQAKEAAEQVQRYDAALKSIIKNYSDWLNVLQNGSTAEKLAVMSQIKNSMADTLGISENVISNSFATTTKNLEDMRLALEGDKLAYERLQQATYNDILIHVGLNDVELNNVKTYLNNYFNNNPELNLNVPVGANLNRDGLDKVLAELIRRGIKTEEQLEAIFASWNVDLDVVIIDGVAQIHSYTKAATYELKEQEKSQEKLKDLERDRVKNQKELTKFLKDERDIYHEINKLLSDQERTIKRITRNQQDMYGTELLDNLNAESAEYEKQQKLLKSKQKLQQQDLTNKKANLTSKGASFDVNGNISNYNNLVGNAINSVNEIISRERGIQAAMNQHLLNGGSTSDEAYKDLELKLTEIGREKSQANDYLNDLKTDLSNYEKVKDEAEDVADQLTEISEKQIEINLKKFNMKLEVTLDLSQATKTWNDYKRNVLQHDNIFNPNKTLSAQKDNAQRLADIDTDSRSLNQVNQQIAAAMADNGNLYKTQGQKKKAIEELQKKTIELRKGILDKEDAIKQTYLEQYNIIGEIFDKQKAQYDFINNQLEHNKNMMKLVYGENNYVAQNVYNDKMIENNLKSIESMNNRVKIAEENLQKARKSGNTAVIEAAEQEWQTAIQNRNQLEEQSAQLLKDRYTTAINQIAHQMEQKLTNGKGFNYLDTQWDLMKKQSNLYLDDINSAFAIKNTEYLYNQVLNDTKGLKNQQQLKKVMNEQLEILKEKDKLTQYDVDRAQKMLEVEKARIALEQARDNKTQMRLKRDSQGNYSYQYVADQDNIAKAENDLAKAENDLYNFDKENYEKSLEEAYNATKEYQEKIKTLNEEYINATEERRKQIDEEIRLLEAQYSDYILNLSQETEWGKQNLMQSTMISFSDMMNQEQIDFENMSDALKEKWLGDMVPSINSGIAEMISKFSTNPDSFKQIVVEATQAMDNERKTYQEGLAELQTAAGQNWNKIKQAMDPVVELQNKLIENNDRLKEQAGEIVTAMNGTLTALDAQEKKWEKVYEQTDNAVKRVYDYIAAIDEAAFKKANEENNKTVKDTTNKTIPTVNSLETYGNAAPGGAGSGDKTGTPIEDGNFKKEQLSTEESDSSILSKGLNDLIDTGYINDLHWYQGQLTLQGIRKAQEFVRDYKTNEGEYGEFTKTIKTKLKYLRDEAFRKKFVAAWNRKYQQDKMLPQFDTGGYTGDWSSSKGKLAVLHQKELVLNKEDTANMLEMIQMVREMQQNELKFRMANLNNEIQDVIRQNSQIEKIKSQQELLEQSVAITANFPSVNSKKEIEEALSELVNKATQLALKVKKI